MGADEDEGTAAAAGALTARRVDGLRDRFSDRDPLLRRWMRCVGAASSHPSGGSVADMHWQSDMRSFSIRGGAVEGRSVVLGMVDMVGGDSLADSLAVGVRICRRVVCGQSGWVD